METIRLSLDSGAYTAWKQGHVLHVEQYAEVVQNNPHFDVAFNLDVIGDGKASYENWEKLNALGVHTIPVYHIGTEEIWLKKYLEKSEYIGLGAIANLDTVKRLQGLSSIWKRYLVDSQGLPSVKVHGMGLTAVQIMCRYPWYSVDSITPRISAIWGGVILPKFRVDGTPNFSELVFCKISDQANHIAGSYGSFVALPKTFQVQATSFVESHGFTVGDIYYQKKRPTRASLKVKDTRPESLLDLPIVEGAEEHTLAGSWKERVSWNLVMWNYLKHRLPIWPRPLMDDAKVSEDVVKGNKTILYIGVAGEHDVELCEQVSPRHDLLVSNEYLTVKLNQSLQMYKYGDK